MSASSLPDTLNILELEAVCADYCALAGGTTAFWIEDLNGAVIAHSGGSRRGRTARSALMRRQQVRYAACACGESANAMVPFFARACQREFDHRFGREPDESPNKAFSSEASGVVHDLNNLLGTISGNAELLSIAVADSPRGREQAVRILRACRLSRLFVARLGQPDVSSTVRAPVDLVAVADDILALTSAKTTARAVLVNETGLDPPMIEADTLAMEQLFFNLILNALSAVEANGSIEVRLTKRAADDTMGDAVTISVRDDGRGMEEEMLAALRAGNVSPDSPSGIGFGLVRSIVAAHGGRLDVTSALGSGTVVDIVLPLRVATSNDEADAAGGPRSNGAQPQGSVAGD